MDDNKIFAKIKYEGALVEDGYLDAKKSGLALLGIDDAIKYFIYQESSAFDNIEFEVPVKVQKGSWETVFPDNIDEILLKTCLFWGTAKYFGTALGEMAKSDFKDFGFKDVFKGAFKAMTWVAKIALHMGTLAKKKFDSIEFSKDNRMAGILNEKGEILWVPVEYLESYSNCPAQIFDKLANIVENERELVITYTDDFDGERARISNSDKFIFTNHEAEEEILFPELEHGKYYELEGHITRGNENSNTVGFYYKNHVLTSYPEKGNVRDFRNYIFSNCTLKGFVDRMDKKGKFIEKRPRIRFTEIIYSSNDNRQRKLFDDE